MKLDTLQFRSKKYFNSFNANTLYINNTPLDEVLYNLSKNIDYKNLLCAWNFDLWDTHDQSEKNYIHAALKNKNNHNIPILLCPDDFDFWCTIVVVKIRYMNNQVCWQSFGIVNNKNFDIEKWKQSGYQNLESWTKDDWLNYGEEYSSLSVESKKQENLWTAKWEEENKRRINKYYYEYFNNDDNIDWIENSLFYFDYESYISIIQLLLKKYTPKKELI